MAWVACLYRWTDRSPYLVKSHKLASEGTLTLQAGIKTYRERLPLVSESVSSQIALQCWKGIKKKQNKHYLQRIKHFWGLSLLFLVFSVFYYRKVLCSIWQYLAHRDCATHTDTLDYGRVIDTILHSHWLGYKLTCHNTVNKSSQGGTNIKGMLQSDYISQ